VKEIIEFIAKDLVDHPDEVRVSETEERGRVVVRLEVAEDELRQGDRQGRPHRPGPAGDAEGLGRAPQRVRVARDRRVRRGGAAAREQQTANSKQQSGRRHQASDIRCQSGHNTRRARQPATGNQQRSIPRAQRDIQHPASNI